MHRRRVAAGHAELPVPQLAQMAALAVDVALRRRLPAAAQADFRI